MQMRNILYYDWNENSADDMIESLCSLGHQVKRISMSFSDYDADLVFETRLRDELEKETYDCIFTFDFFPIISHTAQTMNIPYISWIYDMPHTTLFSPQIKNAVNHIFVFDHMLYRELKTYGYPCHLYHQPLPVHTERIVRELGYPPLYAGSQFPVSFVGSLYDNCMYNRITYLPEYLKGYFQGVMEAQQKIQGYNFVDKVLTPDILEELKKWVVLEIPSEYTTSYKNEVVDMINAKITSTERIRLLNKIAETTPLVLFSGSDGRSLVPKAQYGGVVDYQKEMPAVFRTSKINLNITLRSIVSGIPLRALDIMGAGGFLLSNYQPELTEYFVEMEDCVIYDSEEDLLNKVEYYMSHESERNEIACNGFYKVQEFFSYEKQIVYMLGQVFET